MCRVPPDRSLHLVPFRSHALAAKSFREMLAHRPAPFRSIPDIAVRDRVRRPTRRVSLRGPLSAERAAAPIDIIPRRALPIWKDLQVAPPEFEKMSWRDRVAHKSGRIFLPAKRAAGENESPREK